MSETDMTEYAELREEKAATPHNELIAQLLDSRVPKSEREHAAAREIFKLLRERDELVKLVMEMRGTLRDLRIHLHAAGRRPEECYEMSMIDDALDRAAIDAAMEGEK